MQMRNRGGYEGLNMMGVCTRRIHGFMVIVIIALSPYNVQMVHSKLYSLGGLYSATTNIIDAANIAYDIRDMLVVSGQVNLLNSVESNETSLTPQDIYNNGKNSGKSLRQMSTESKSIMEGEPLYMFYRYFHDSGDIDGPGDYADKLVTEYFNRNVTWWAHTTDEAALFLNLWMYVVHHLEIAVEACRENNPTKAVENIDFAAAYYIGSDQTDRTHKTGWLLYSKIQEIGHDIGTLLESSGMARANHEILINLFPEVLKKINISQCKDSSDYKDLRVLVDMITRQMNVPLMQNLLIYIHLQEFPKVKVFATALLPQIAACSHKARSTYLKRKLLDQNNFEKSSKSLMISNLQESFSCLGLTCDMVGVFGCDKDTQFNKLAILPGYTSSSDVSNHCLIEEDISQIDLLLNMNATKAAYDLYSIGRNSKSVELSSYGFNFYRSLKSIATSSKKQNVGLHHIFSKFFNNSDYTDSILSEILNENNAGLFVNASHSQKAAIATGTLRNMVLMIHSLSGFYMSLHTCQIDKKGSLDGLTTWEESIAYLVGSNKGVGNSFHGQASDLCDFFQTCTSLHNEAKINSALQYLYRVGRTYIENSECNDLQRTVENIESSLLVSLFQGTLYSAVRLSNLKTGSLDETIGVSYAFARSILPIMNESFPGSNIILEDMLMSPVFDGSILFENHGIEKIVSTVKAALSRVNVDCTDIGFFHDPVNYEVVYNVCTDPTILGNGLYITYSDVSDWLQISLDIKAMENYLNKGNLHSAKEVYLTDRDSMTLTGLSTTMWSRMKGEPTFLMYLYALGSSTYAHNYISSILNGPDSNHDTLATEASVALGVWMYVVHLLQDSIKDCKSSEESNSATSRHLFNNGKGKHASGEAAALWIGDEQFPGRSNSGYLLYNLSESMGEIFGTKINGQSKTNTEFLRLLRSLNSVLSFRNSCTQGSNTYKVVRVLVEKMLVQMTIPLIQSLIYYMSINDTERMKLYAKAALPRVMSCNMESYFNILKPVLIDGKEYEPKRFPEMLKALQKVYPCLGISCSDIGGFDRETKICTDPEIKTPLAGYIPLTDVRENARIDIDILQIGIFMSLNASDTAREIYTIGANSRESEIFRALYSLSTNPNRAEVPQYSLFENYFNDGNYADTLVTKALNEVPPFDPSYITIKQRTLIVRRTLQYMVMYMAPLTEMYTAINDCESDNDIHDKTQRWDIAAAYIVGSIDSNNGDNGDNTLGGQLLFDLGKRFCKDFGTCSNGFATVNDRIMSLLQTGQAHIVGTKCKDLKTVVNDIEKLLIVPLIQGIIVTASGSDGLQAGTTSKTDFVEGFVYANSLLPIINRASSDSATIISRNMIHPFTTRTVPIPDGREAVFDALLVAIPKMGVDCENVGVYQEYDFCRMLTADRSTANTSVIIIIILVIVVVSAFFFLFMKRKTLPKALFIGSRHSGEIV